MKKLMVAAVLAVASAAFGEMKIGTVDLMKLVRNHPRYETDKSMLSDTEKEHTKKLDAMKSDLESIQKEGQGLAEQLRSPMLAATAKAKIEKDLMGIQEKFMRGQQNLRTEAMQSQRTLQEMESKFLKATTDQIRAKIDEYAKKNGYDFIVDANVMPYSKADYDVTPAILRALGVDPDKVAKDDEGK